MNKAEQLTGLPYWSSLTDAQREYVRKNSVINRYSKGSIIHGCSDSCLGMMLVISGEIRVFLLSEEGREVTLFRLAQGNPCVLSASCVLSQITFETQMVVESDCELLIVNSGAYAHLCEENINVRCFTYELTCERFSSVMWTMQQILFNRLDRRLATFLIAQANRCGGSEIKMTHEEIARQISSAREVVARMLKRFSADGLVELKRGSIVITNLRALSGI